MACLGLTAMGAREAAAAKLVVAQDGMGSATDCNTSNPTPYTTISAAVTAANPGDTIKVCPGLYVEQVQINKNNLTLLGAQAGIDARTPPFVPDPPTQSMRSRTRRAGISIT